MTAYIVDERGRYHIMATRRRNPVEAVCDLMEHMMEPIRVRESGLFAAPVEEVAERFGGRVIE